MCDTNGENKGVKRISLVYIKLSFGAFLGFGLI